MDKGYLHLDYNASAGLDPAVFEALTKDGFSFLNPSSAHLGGQGARAKIEAVREEFARYFGSENKITFTSGATEANNTALLLPVLGRLGRGSLKTHSIVVSSIEHPSVLEAASRLGEWGIDVRIARPEAGAIESDAFVRLVDESTLLVSAMAVNNETGYLLPIKEIFKGVKAKNPAVITHCDAVQAFGKIAISMKDAGIDLLSISGHKIGALSGIGALISAPGIPFEPFIVGGSQETRRRAGTENVVGILSLGYALTQVMVREAVTQSQLAKGMECLKSALISVSPKAVINFPAGPQVGNTLSVRFPGLIASDLVVALDQVGVLVSAGSACASGKTEPSYVLTELGLSDVEATETIRISFGPMTPLSVLSEAAERIVVCVERMWQNR